MSDVTYDPRAIYEATLDPVELRELIKDLGVTIKQDQQSQFLATSILNNYVKYRKLMDHTSPEYRDLLDMLRRSLKGNGLA